MSLFSKKGIGKRMSTAEMQIFYDNVYMYIYTILFPCDFIFMFPFPLRYAGPPLKI